MAYRRQDMTRLGSDGSFPNQKLKNASSATSNDGTLFDEACVGDWFQFFQKCFEESGIVPNGNPDNGNTLNQLYEAVLGEQWKEVGNDGGATSFLNNASGSTGIFPGGKPIRYRKINGGLYVHLEGWLDVGDSSGNPSFLLPSGYRPDQGSRSIVSQNDGGMITLDVLSTGEVVLGNTIGLAYINIILPL